MRLLSFITFLTIALTSYGQTSFNRSNISKTTGKIVSKIEKKNELMGSAVYYAGIRPEQYDLFIRLMEVATKDELIELTSYPNGVVRCYSFWALSYDSSINLLPIIIRHIKDEELVNTQFGCIGSSEKVGDFFISIATPGYVDLNSKKLDSAQFAELDSVLIYVPNNLYSKADAIGRARPTESLYLKIRELVTLENNQVALVALAKYQKEQDIELILKNRNTKRNIEANYFTYQAISEFPHPSFFPFLVQNLKNILGDDHFSTEWRALYKAIASYKNSKAVKLLNVPFTQVKHENIRQYHIDFVYEALQVFKSPIYDDLLWQLWTEEKRITVDVFKYLYIKNQVKAFKLTEQTLLNSDNFNFSSFDFDGSGNLLKQMLDIVVKQDKQLGIEILNKNIKYVNVLQFPIFADKAIELKDTSFIITFFERLEKEDNPHVFLKATEALISFNDYEINKRIVATSKKNKNLEKGWGGEAFDELLKKNNIR